MRMVNWCFFSKQETEKDFAFLKSHQLSDEQASAISQYFYKKISADVNKTAIFTAIIVAVAYSIDW